MRLVGVAVRAVGQGWCEQPPVPQGSWWVHVGNTSVLWCPVTGPGGKTVPGTVVAFTRCGGEGGVRSWGACAASVLGLFLLK